MPMRCKRCGASEDRIDGYCTVECRDLHEVEQERDQALAERDDGWEIARDEAAKVEHYRDRAEAAEQQAATYRLALRVIDGPADSFDPFMDVYQAAGGGYEGLQAIARAALSLR